MPILKKEYHRLIYLFGLLLFAASLPLSKYFMSVAQMLLIGNWICEADYKNKLRRFAQNKAALAACLIMALHFVGLLWTSDFDYAFKDIRIKLPLLIMPFIVASTEELSLKNIYTILLVHAGAVLAGTLISVWLLLFTVVNDIRNVSVLISHIRFGMNVCFAVFTTTWMIYRAAPFKSMIERIVASMIVIWFVLYLFITGSVTGIGIMVVTGLLLVLRFIFTKARLSVKVLVAGAALAGSLGMFFYISGIVNEYKNVEPIKLSELELKTPYGNAYQFNFANKQIENGHYTWMYICWDEVKDAWNKRSTINFDSNDRKGQPVRYTIVRYITSKGLRKDNDGVNSLSADDINAIEDGVADIRYGENGNFRDRVINLLWEYDNYQLYADPSGQTMMQRVELWKTSLLIIAAHPWLGVGTGDGKNEFREELVQVNSPLKDLGLRSHNQYLAILISFGLIGFIIFLFALLYPAVHQKRFFTYLYFIFICIMLISMFTEDTLESQPGVSFFAFWNALLLLGWRKENNEKKQIPNNEKEKTIAGLLFKRRHKKTPS
jgi:hypothetical protein